MPLHLAVKFCGGCDPAFDRLRLLERLRQAAPNDIDFMRSGYGRPEALLLICGCAAACPLKEVSESIPVFVIDRDLDTIETLIVELKRKGGSHGTYRIQG